MFFPVKIQEVDPGQFLATCRFIPECTFVAKSHDEAVDLAAQAVPGTLELCYRRKKKSIPLPDGTLHEGEIRAYVPIKVQLKIALWNIACDRKMNLSVLARTLHITPTQAQRLVDLSIDKASTESIEAALSSLGVHHTVISD